MIAVDLGAIGNLGSGVFATVVVGEVGAGRGEGVQLKHEGKPFGKARVVDRWCGDLANVPAALLECCSDPLMRTFTGLSVALQAYAPGWEAKADARVTALVLLPVAEEKLVVASAADARRLAGG